MISIINIFFFIFFILFNNLNFNKKLKNFKENIENIYKKNIKEQIIKNRILKLFNKPLIINDFKLKKATITTLKNGLKIIFIEDKSIPIFTINLLFDNSLIKEKNIEIKNLIVDLIFSGTKNYSKEKLSEKIDDLRIDLELLPFQIKMKSLNKYFEKTLKLLSEVILNANFKNENELELIKNNKRISIEISKKDINYVSDLVSNILLYGKDYVKISNLENISLSDIKHFYKENIIPNNSYLIFRGNIDKNKVIKLINFYFKKWKRKKNNNFNFKKFFEKINLNKEKEINLVDFPKSKQSNISLIKLFKLKKTSKDYYSLFLANYILGMGSSSRLFNNLREKNNYTYGAYSTFNVYENYIGEFIANSSVNTNFTFDAVKEFLKEIKLMNYLTDQEIEEKKEELIGDFLLSLENLNFISSLYFSMIKEKLPNDYYNNYLNNINNVTKKDIQKVVNNYLSEDNMKILIIGDVKKFLPEIKKMKVPINLLDRNGNIIKRYNITNNEINNNNETNNEINNNNETNNEINNNNETNNEINNNNEINEK